uniref:Flavonoid 3',5'-hydroxylase n=1 Tax=Pohlia nutans TaxID=140635 RepID=W5XJS5_9BRYO|nr:flavonoid 3',5'-hydroxylase [Pohlia nutans]
MMLPFAADSYGAWSVVAAVVVGILLLRVFTSKPKNLPPGPRGLPIIGSLHLLGKYPHQDLAKLANIYGPVMSLWFGQKLTVVATSPEAAKEFLKTQGPNFSSRLKTSFGEIVSTGDIVMAPDSPARLHLKKILHMQLSTAKQLQLSENVRTEEIAHVLRVIPQDGATVVQVRTYVEVVVVNILSRMILKKRFMAGIGKEHEGQELEEVRKFRTLSEEIAELSVHIDPSDFISIFKLVDLQGYRRRLRNLKARMDAFMSNIVSEHLVQRKLSGSLTEKDMVDVLLDQMEDKTLRFDITDKSVYSVLWNAFVAGAFTSTHTVEWAMSECIRNPTIMRRAQEELDVVVGKSRRVEDGDIPKLKYLQAIIKETLRLHPETPLLLPHKNEDACKAFGYDIPAQTCLMVNVGAIARDPSVWEDPLEFKPERFLDGMPHANVDYQGNHFELLPFGSGRRLCPGMVLGTTMVHILVATLLHSFDWTLPNGLQPMDLDMSEAEGILNVLAKPFRAIPKARLSISSNVG